MGEQVAFWIRKGMNECLTTPPTQKINKILGVKQMVTKKQIYIYIYIYI